MPLLFSALFGVENEAAHNLNPKPYTLNPDTLNPNVEKEAALAHEQARHGLAVLLGLVCHSVLQGLGFRV